MIQIGLISAVRRNSNRGRFLSEGATAVQDGLGLEGQEVALVPHRRSVMGATLVRLLPP